MWLWISLENGKPEIFDYMDIKSILCVHIDTIFSIKIPSPFAFDTT